MTIIKTVRCLTALAALAALQACHGGSQMSAIPAAAYDPWKTYKLGNVYDCENIARPDMRHNNEQLPSPGFGCAHQSNITLMASNPNDLMEPRPMTPGDPRRGQRVLEAYGAGQDTSSARATEGTQQLIE
jgi:hypothetical protein